MGSDPVPCDGMTDVFFGPELDGRNEVGRKQRERFAKSVCFRCPVRIACLRKSVANDDPWGVWGGMAEGERRKFVIFLAEELGYGEVVPDGFEFRAAVRQFYEQQEAQVQPRRKRPSA